jgi:hypothetical protein
MDKHEKIIIYNCEFFLKKSPKEWLVIFGSLTIFLDGS